MNKRDYCTEEVEEIYRQAERDASRAFLRGAVWGSIATAMFVRWILPMFE